MGLTCPSYGYKSEKPILLKETQAHKLLKKYREGTLTEDEKIILDSWYLDMARSAGIEIKDGTLNKRLNEIWDSFPFTIKPVVENKAVKFWPKCLAAASALLALLSGTYYFYPSTPADKQAAHETKTRQDDVPPGDDRAILTLANGRQIVLEDAKKGKVATERNTTITKSKEGEVIYDQFSPSPVFSPGTALAVIHNTIATPKAGQYQVKLPDGTRVWLNAASSLRFPTAFSQLERVVEMTGEAYFEVAKIINKGRRVPFKVVTKTQTIEVLGTRFNVNSYTDEESIKTTLVEGSIKVHLAGDHNKGLLLNPGQQAQFLFNIHRDPGGKQPLRVQDVDTHSVIAWKEGHFKFDNIGLPELMRQLSRWYDVQVLYEGKTKEYEFVGQIERNTNLSGVLQILEAGGVHLRLEGKRIIITE